MKRQSFWTIVLTIVMTIVALPIYWCDILDIIIKNIENNELRVDIANYGSKNNTVEVLEVSNLISYRYPEWFMSSKGNGVAINLKALDKYLDYTIKIKAIGSGEMKLFLRGPYRRIDDKSIPVMISYDNLLIDNKKILEKRKRFWHDKPFKQSFKVTDGEIVEIKFSARGDRIKLSDIYRYAKIDYLMLIIVITLSFLLSYKLVNYLSKFKIDNEHSRIDIVFLSMFFALLFVPMANISDAEKSIRENRMLATKPLLKDFYRGKKDYGMKFAKWFNDRFYGRDKIIYFYDSIKYSLNNIVKNDKAIMLDDDMILNVDILNRLKTVISDKKLKIMSSNILKLQEFCKNNNIQLYIIIPPAKEDVYFEKAKLYSIKYQSPIYKLIDTVKRINNLTLFYPRDLYLKKHTEFTHFKTDHHWTEYGAFIAYNEFINNISVDFPEIISLQESDFITFYNNKPRLGSFINMFDRPFYRGSDCDRLALNKKNCPLSYQYKYYDHKDKHNLNISMGPIKMSRITHYDKGIPKNVTLLGNSYGGFLMQFLPYNFQNLQMLRVNNEDKNVKNVYDMERFEKHILEFKTDILIFYLASSYIDDLLNLYPKD